MEWVVAETGIGRERMFSTPSLFTGPAHLSVTCSTVIESWAGPGNEAIVLHEAFLSNNLVKPLAGCLSSVFRRVVARNSTIIIPCIQREAIDTSEEV